MKAIECEAPHCKGYIAWNEKIEEYVCNECGAIHK